MLSFFRKYPLVYALLFGLGMAFGMMQIIAAFDVGNYSMMILIFVITAWFQFGGLKLYQYKIYNYIAKKEKSPE